jgi:hypothetical protein
MTLPASGAISLGEVNTELGLSSTTQISLNDTAVREISFVAGSTIAMNNLWGKNRHYYSRTAPTYFWARRFSGGLFYSAWFYWNGTLTDLGPYNDLSSYNGVQYHTLVATEGNSLYYDICLIPS